MATSAAAQKSSSKDKALTPQCSIQDLSQMALTHCSSIFPFTSFPLQPNRWAFIGFADHNLSLFNLQFYLCYNFYLADFLPPLSNLQKPAQVLFLLSDHSSPLKYCPKNFHSLLLVTLTQQIIIYSLMIFLLLFYFFFLVLFTNVCCLLFSLRVQDV